MSIEVVILAAGQGTRMRSRLPKVLHPIAGKPMLGHVIDTVEQIGADHIHVVVGHGAEQVKACIGEGRVDWVLQEEQLGTGHAVAQAMPGVSGGSIVLVAYGDVPLVTTETFRRLVEMVDENTLALLTVNLQDPTGYGRVLRNEQGAVSEIVEQKDANEEQLAVREVNTGILAVHASRLNDWLPQLSAENAQGEYYLTDIIAMAVKDGMQVSARQAESPLEVQGVNNRQQQSELERFYQMRKAEELMQQGVTLADPGRLDVRGSLHVGHDVFIDINCVFVGDVQLGDGVSVGPNCVLENCQLGAGSTVKANSIIEDSRVGENCDVGPFARLRPGTNLGDSVRIGNFVETKNTILGEGSKVNHLSYIGDSEVGKGVNIGAGTITCNYDGANKHKTIIGDNSFVGSNTALVAPVTIGESATIGAGSTVTQDVKAQQLSIARGKQRNIDNWKRPQKSK